MIYIYYALGFIFYLTFIVIHLMVINKTIPYTDVNGGKSASYEIQRKTSVSSVIIISIFFLLLAIFSINSSLIYTLFGLIYFGVLSLYWLFSLILQLLGTKFEKRYLSIIVSIGLFSHVMLFFESLLN